MYPPQYTDLYNVVMRSILCSRCDVEGPHGQREGTSRGSAPRVQPHQPGAAAARQETEEGNGCLYALVIASWSSCALLFLSGYVIRMMKERFMKL